MYHIYTALTKAFLSFFLNIFSTLPVSPFALVCQTYDFQIITIYYLESKSHSVIGPWIGEINIQNKNQNIFKISAIFGDFSISREMYSLAMPDSMYVFILMPCIFDVYLPSINLNLHLKLMLNFNLCCTQRPFGKDFLQFAQTIYIKKKYVCIHYLRCA